MAVVGINSDTSNGTSLSIIPPAGAQQWLAFMWCAISPPLEAPTGWTAIGHYGSPETDRIMVYRSTGSPASTWTRSDTFFPFSGIVVGYDHAGSLGALVPAPDSLTSPSAPAAAGDDVIRIWSGVLEGNVDMTPPPGTSNFEAARVYVAADGLSGGAYIAHSTQSTDGETGAVEWAGPALGGAGATIVLAAPVQDDEPPSAPTSVAVTGSERAVEIDFEPVDGADEYLVQWRRTDLNPPAPTVQQNAPWYLSRGTVADLPHPSTYTYTWDGSGVTVYCIDVGIRATHDEFQNTTVEGVSVGGQWDEDPGDHGTGVMAMAVGAGVGVAKGADAFMARIEMNLETYAPTLEEFIAARDAIIAHANGKHATLFLPNAQPAGDLELLEPLYEAGISVIVSSGNTDTEVNTLPIEFPRQPLFIGSTTADDEKAGYSNYGDAVNLYAAVHPAQVAAGYGDSEYWSGSGTSHASPIVAGVDAKILQGNPRLSVARRMEVILSQAFRDKLTLPAGSHNLLLNVNASTEEWSDHTTSTSSLTLDGLDDDATYEIRVAVVSGGLISDWSTPAEATTAEPPTQTPTAYLGHTPVAAMYVGDRLLTSTR